MKRHAILALSTILLGSSTASADPEMGMPSHEIHQTFAFGAPAPATTATRTIRIVMKDNSFEPASISVRAGDVIRFVVTNGSDVAHEFVLGDTASQKEHRAEMAAMATAGSMTMDDDPNAIAVTAHERGTITWKFTAAGIVEYACDIPGHYEAGMHGTIAVQRANGP